MRTRVGYAHALPLLLALPAHALTVPVAGAVAKHPDLSLCLPFEDDTRVLLTSGYGPNGGSNLHDHTNLEGRANGYYALDMVLPDYGNNGHGQPVVAATAGRVVKAGWATAGWANYGLRVIIQTDGPDGSYHQKRAAVLKTRLRWAWWR